MTRPDPSPSPIRPPAGTLAGLLADEDRLRVLSAVALGARSPAAAARATGLADQAVLKALERLGASGVVVQLDGGLGVDRTVFAHAARRDAEARRRAEPTPESLGATAEQAAVLKNFLSQGRLAQLPSNRGRRIVVLDFLAARFEPGRRYSEKEVNQHLAPLHDDVATLRRYLVDEGLMDRDQGVYWRSGGSFVTPSVPLVRPIQPDDRPGVVQTVLQAFSGPDRDGREEVDIVERTWELGAAVDGMDLVAELDGEVVGHVLGARVDLAGRPAVGVAPLSVRPDHQGQGMGSALMRALLGAADEQAWPLVVVLGPPAYYGRFGFEPAHRLGIWYAPVGAGDVHFQVARCRAYDASWRGQVTYCWELDGG